MSQEIIDAFKQEIDGLKRSLDNYKQAIDGLSAQLEASKQMYNETVNQLYQAKTSHVGQSKLTNDYATKAQAHEQTIASLNQQLSDATAKIATLENPIPIEQDYGSDENASE
jgi:chromosome segregation ATPase